MLSSMNFNNGGSCLATAAAPTEAQHNRFNSIKISHRSDKLGSVDKYAGINVTDASAKLATNYTKDTGQLGIINNNNNNNSNINNNNINTNNNDSQSVTYFLLKTLNNNNNIATLTNEGKLFRFGEDNKTNCNASNQSNGERFETDGDESNESGTIDVVGAEVDRNGVDHRSHGNGLSGDEKAPDHHARRPMNAFLIFCKCHRAIVREKYPNLENRSITKILGDWWVNLDKEEKVCYTDLAKQYKDAFFSANPNFKWYKLPAPPLRSIPMQTRPDRHDSFSDPSYDDCETMSPMSKISHGSIDIDYENNAQHKLNENPIKSSVGLFKLADEAQMGGLNSLMMAAEVVSAKSPSSKNPNRHEYRVKVENAIEQDELDKQNALHRELGETHSYIERTINGLADDADVFSTVPYQSKIKQEQTSDRIIPIKNFTYAKSSHGSPEKSFEFDLYEDEGSGGDNINSNAATKSTRACKGKRYLEFMNARKYNPIARKSKSRSTSTSSASLSPTEHPRNGKSFSNATANSNASRKMDYETFDHLYANHNVNSMPMPTPSNKYAETVVNGGKLLADAMKLFDANDFDLEAKIKALPRRSLDKYLSRKRDTKKKKKCNGKRSSNGGFRKNTASKNTCAAATKKSPVVLAATVVAPPKTIEEAKERLMMVGSQKRKARKESITRRDVKPSVAITESIPSPTPSVSSHHTNDSKNPSSCAPDLLILATMAEKAAANFGV